MERSTLAKEGTATGVSGITRRGFLKTAGAVTGGLALSSLASTSLVGCSNATTSVAQAAEEETYQCVCRPNCFGFCHLNVHVRDGVIVKTSRAPYKDPRYSRICQRGLTHPQRIYQQDRIKYPLRRVEGSPRGGGEWERISWDEAISEFAGKIKEAQAEYGDEGFAVMSQSGNAASVINSNFYSRLWSLVKPLTIQMCYDYANTYALSRMTGPMTQIWEANELTDIVNAKSIVTWGANIGDSQVHNWHFIKEAMQGGTKLVVVDPTFTQVAAKADWWIPIRPGSDTAAYLGIMNIIVEKDAVDKEYLLSQTVAPFLVRSDTGKFLRYADVNKDAGDRGEEYMVVSKGSVVPLGEGKADLSGSVEVEGVKCRTAYDLLLDRIAEMTPEKASELTDIPVDDLYKLADICCDGPVTHYCGFGSSAYMNGVQCTHAGMTMCALTGNLGKPGASFGAFWHFFFGVNFAWTMPMGPNTSRTIPIFAMPDVIEAGGLDGVPYTPKVIYFYYSNVLATESNSNAIREKILDHYDYIVVADSVMTDTASYADLVLPTAQFFEQFDCTAAGQTTAFNWSEKAIDPLYESKTDMDIVRLLAEALGFGELFQMTDEEALEDLLDTDLARLSGATVENLRENREARIALDNPHIAFTDFSTPSGRLEFYVENPAPRIVSTKELTPERIELEHLPHWFPPAEAWPDSELRKKYPIHLMSKRPRFRVHTTYHEVPTLQELDTEPIVYLNPADLAERGIADGDYVECFNDRGHCVARAVESEGVRVGTGVYPKGYQAWQHKAGRWSELTSNDYDPFSVNGNIMDLVCEIRAWRGEE